MSLFETLKNAIFHNPMAHSGAGTAAPTPAPRPAGPAANTRTPAATTTTAAPAPTASSPPAAVDVEAVMETLNARSAQKLNWRTSIVDLMKLVGLDSSLQNRKQLATELGYSGDVNDSAAMNIWLHKAVMTKLAQNGGKVPSTLQ
jgi:3-oxoacyl-ACP reductase-like protein